MKKSELKKLAKLESKDFDELTVSQMGELFSLRAMSDCEANSEQLFNIMNEAEARVWFDRNVIGTIYEDEGIPEDIRQGALKAAEEYKQRYGLTEEEVDDYYHGYWSGILALSRFLYGGFGTNLDTLRDGDDGLLDT